MECKEPVWPESLTTAPRYKFDLRGVQEVSGAWGGVVVKALCY